MPKGLVIFHGSCWDGFCAAWLMHHFYGGEEMEYHPAQYDESPPDVTGRDVWVLDFSYPRSVLEEMHRSARSLTVLDHHKTAQADLEGLPYCTFDMGLSGAQLTWLYLRKHSTVVYSGVVYAGWGAPWLVDYTADRDLWLWKLPDSKEVNAALRSYPLDFAVWDRLWAEESPETLKRDGAAILRAEEVTIQVHIDRAREIDFDGYKVLSVNATSLFSEYSLRSRDDGVDVSEIAKAHGGGGHAKAAGFEERI